MVFGHVRLYRFLGDAQQFPGEREGAPLAEYLSLPVVDSTESLRYPVSTLGLDKGSLL